MTGPQNPLYERYASAEMAALFSSEHRFALWRHLWVTLARCQRELGLAISQEQIAELERAASSIDLKRVAELERETRHDVVAHLRHFAEQAGAAGGILHLGATSAFVTDNADVMIARQALELLKRRLATVILELTELAHAHRATPCLAYTHLQPAQLTTMGKRACLWIQDLVVDLEETARRAARLLCRGVKGTTGTQASFLILFEGDHDKVRELDRRVAERLGFQGSWPLTGQTYPRKQDSQVLQTLAGIAESCHKLGSDIRLLQGLGELNEPFDEQQVGSSAMPYKRNPIRSERMCGLARRLITDSLNGPLNAATQWLERSLDDSANRRLVLGDSFLTCDALLLLAANIASGLWLNESQVRTRVAAELPFMATETLLVLGTQRGGDRQQLHERLRRYSLQAYEELARGGPNRLIERIRSDPEFRLEDRDLETLLDPMRFCGRAQQQVEEFLSEVVEPALRGIEAAPAATPRI